MRRTRVGPCAIAMRGTMRMLSEARQKPRRDIEYAPCSRAIRSLGRGWVSANYRRRAPSVQLRWLPSRGTNVRRGLRAQPVDATPSILIDKGLKPLALQ